MINKDAFSNFTAYSTTIANGSTQLGDWVECIAKNIQ
jgi:hypothetical protein